MLDDQIVGFAHLIYIYGIGVKSVPHGAAASATC